ncbi:MAG: hypothetical protein E6I95_06395 [Chloroflexi bacterium]|nr:MAG: hypothetical protein E6I95_06395 [Chloroflexota bacterium]
MKYVLMFAGSVQEQEAWEKMPEAVRVTAYERVNQWFEEHSRAGRITGGAELQGPSSSTTVRIKNGKAVVTDGPFIEAKEVIGGFAIVEVKDLDEALGMAKTWPGGGIVEVRPVVDHEND